MLLLMNVGNSNTQLADVDDAGDLGNLRCMETAAFDPALLPHDVTIAIASVVKDMPLALPPSDEVFYIDSSWECGVNFSAVDASTVGADRVANAAELAATAKLPAAVIDFGTAVTFEVVDAERMFRGGAILPGRKLLRRALHKWTSQLPELPWSPSLPDCAGANTLGAMRLGIDRGAVGAVREVMTVLKKQFPNIAFVGIGGDSGYFLKAFPEIGYGGDDFTLRGIRRIFETRFAAR